MIESKNYNLDMHDISLIKTVFKSEIKRVEEKIKQLSSPAPAIAMEDDICIDDWISYQNQLEMLVEIFE